MSTVPYHLRRRGLSLVEVTLGITLSAVLLIAVGAALHASINAYRHDQEQAILANRARLAMNSMLMRARAASAFGASDAKRKDFEDNKRFKAKIDGKDYDLGIEDTSFKMLLEVPKANESNTFKQYELEYTWDEPKKQLMLRVGSRDPVAVLDGVTSFKVNLYPRQSQYGKKKGYKTCDTVERIDLAMTLAPTASAMDQTETTRGKIAAVTVSGSAVPRANGWTGSITGASIDDLLRDPTDPDKFARKKERQ